MYLYQKERDAIVTIVGELAQPEISMYLAKAGLPPIHAFSAATHPSQVIAIEFLAWLEANRARLLAAVQGLLAEYPHHDMASRLGDAAARAGAAGPAAGGLPTDVVLASGRPIINRTPLRRTLRDLVARHPSAPPVVMVDGPSGSGRSHSWYLIEHVASEAGIEAIKFDLTSSILEEQTLPTVARLLARKLRILPHILEPTTVGATPETVADRWAEELSSAWPNRAPATMVWIVLDSLDRALPPDVRRFVCALAARRLSRDITGCVLFFLGAGQDYGVDDPGRLVARETLAVFLDHEVDQAARALAALGRTPLAAQQLDARIAAMVALLAAGTPRDICTAVHDHLALLRVEVSA